MVSPGRVPALAAALAACLALPAPARAEAEHAPLDRAYERDEGRDRHWLLPDHLTAQFAGNVGLLAVGGGHAWRDDRVVGDLLFGWVPESVGGTDIYQLSAKVTWSPWIFRLGQGWKARPFTVGLQVTYLLGGDYFIVQPSRYPSGYYPVPTALHPGLTLGTSLTVPKRYLDAPVSLYVEGVALGHMLRVWAANPRTIGPADVFSFTAGARVQL
ncbi:conserved hypothetical protein [Anaeromyxobacter dehalogenans 2CP-1]|uniref:Outer membrane protein beta-barrel domain-containing protein n=1 Tax=Anaeromyxobacter dehalogenans (strain ATCC BAA-258 / DSM 21875 / 2CP-1) TaxID=455488 RepID=B8JC94_ANAD2|nr:conserved hypothetical protein [Anaeromyxobacter dehalogenans 2CP-1]